MQKPILIGFPACPYVRRSELILREKNVDYELKNIDMSNRPQWFVDISPLGKVPLLQLGDEVLFESGVINEYLDEVYGESLHPKSPLEKAKHRAWIAFADKCQLDSFNLTHAKDKSIYNELVASLQKNLSVLETIIKGPFLFGDHCFFVDLIYVPLLVRLQVQDGIEDFRFLADRPKLSAWLKVLKKRQSVTQVISDEWMGLTTTYLKELDAKQKVLWN